jgi:hypothetical protein
VIGIKNLTAFEGTGSALRTDVDHAGATREEMGDFGGEGTVGGEKKFWKGIVGG